jgi:mannosyltransferase OCH1-like enzyme
MYIPFDNSMQLPSFSTILQRPDFAYVYDVFKTVYEKNSFANVVPSQQVRIPTIIHIMWLGGKLPQEYIKYVTSWSVFHPQWTILFWTDSSSNYDQGTEVVYTFDELAQRLKSVNGGERIVVDTSRLDFSNRCFYDQATNYGEKSDILKWEIVYRFGGTYVDTDFECLQPLDIYHHTYDFYTGIQPLDTNIVQLGAALYGAIPHHPILKVCVETIKDNQQIKQIVAKTGPIHFTKSFLAVAGKTGLRDIALPATYFYPCSYEQRGTDRDVWCKAESYAVHHWAGSWLKPEAFVRS